MTSIESLIYNDKKTATVRCYENKWKGKSFFLDTTCHLVGNSGRGMHRRRLLSNIWRCTKRIIGISRRCGVSWACLKCQIWLKKANFFKNGKFEPETEISCFQSGSLIEHNKTFNISTVSPRLSGNLNFLNSTSARH